MTFASMIKHKNTSDHKRNLLIWLDSQHRQGELNTNIPLLSTSADPDDGPNEGHAFDQNSYSSSSSSHNVDYGRLAIQDLWCLNHTSLFRDLTSSGAHSDLLDCEETLHAMMSGELSQAENDGDSIEDSIEESSDLDDADRINEMEGLHDLNDWSPFKCKEVSTQFSWLFHLALQIYYGTQF